MKSESGQTRRHRYAIWFYALSFSIMASSFFLLSSLCRSRDGNADPPVCFSEQEAIDRKILPLVSNKKGALIIGVTDGRRHRIYAYGLQSEWNRNRPDERTIFEIGSVTKLFTGLLLVDLWRDKLLSFNDPVSKYMPANVTIPTFNKKQITLFELATHTSGMPRDPDNLPAQSGEYGKEHFHAFLQHCRLNTLPGTNYSYSNTGFRLLGEALESAGHQPYWVLLRERILDPLNMQDTVIVLDKKRISRLAQGYGEQGKKIESTPSTGGASGGLKSTVSDLLQLIDCAIDKHDRRLFDDISEACRRRVQIDRLESACPGFFYDSRLHYFHKSGQIDGFSSCIEFSSASRQGMVVLSSSLQFEAEPILRDCYSLVFSSK